MSTSERGQKPKKVVVPSIEEDSAERKRLLNVLAQRRYRRRKKEHLQRLEKLIDQDFSLLSPEPEATSGKVDGPDLTSIHAPAWAYNAAAKSQPMGGLPTTLNDRNVATCIDEEFNQYHQDFPSRGAAFPTDTLTMMQTYEDPFNFTSGSLEAFETSLTFPQPSVPTSPSMTMTSNESHNSLSSSSVPQRTPSEQNVDFPDEAYLPMGELSLLSGAMSIAIRLGCDSIIWSLEANSLFHNSTASLHTHLPPNLRPTRAQLLHPHHPAIDILPWPTVRDRLIFMFAQPERMRPPSAKSPTALVEFVYDLEDPFEGARIHGEDPYSDDNWEVGEKLFQNWWWALDRRVLHRSNQLRLARGAALLGSNNRIQEID